MQNQSHREIWVYSAVRTIDLVTARFSKWLNITAAWFIFLMMVLISGDVLGRRFLNQPIPSSYEFSESLLAAAVFFALAYAQNVKAHVRVTMLVRRLPMRLQTALHKVVLSLFLVVALTWVWQTGRMFVASFVIHEVIGSQLLFVKWPVLLTLPVGFAALSLILVVQLARMLLGEQDTGGDD